MKRKHFFGFLALVLVSALSLSLFGIAAGKGDEGAKFEVTVTNLTKGQILSPAVVATHSSALSPLFTLGSPASPELVAVAEDAVTGPLVASLSADPNVKDVKILQGSNGPIMPGETASVVVNAGGKARYVSLASMLVTTNDAFAALNGVRGPNHGSETHYSPAYDAGSEVNNEDCDFIPGPPCGKPGVRAVNGAEGYVYIHSGIHGIADLVPANHDWQNPVAKIVIRRLHD